MRGCAFVVCTRVDSGFHSVEISSIARISIKVGNMKYWDELNPCFEVYNVHPSPQGASFTLTYLLDHDPSSATSEPDEGQRTSNETELAVVPEQLSPYIGGRVSSVKLICIVPLPERH